MFSTNPASGTHSFSAYLDWSIGLHRSGLRDVQIHVLGTLVEALEITGSLAMGETTVQMSRWEIAQRTGLSVQQVQRALAALVDAGYIVRAQLEKKDGEISRTMLTAKAVEAMGLKGGANLAGDVPPELVALFIGESRACVEAIVSAWNDGRLVDAAAGHAFRGGAKAWAQIDFLLAARMEARQQALQQAQEAQDAAQAAEQREEYPLMLPDGETVVLRSEPFRCGGTSPALRCVDMRFVRDTLSLLAIRHPAMVRKDALTTLVAEIAFSRSAGFVFKHDAGAAARILASCVAKPTWSRPKSIDNRWYQLAGQALRPQGDRF